MYLILCVCNDGKQKCIDRKNHSQDKQVSVDLNKQTETLTITQNKPVCLTIAYTVTVNHTPVDFLSNVSVLLVL